MDFDRKLWSATDQSSYPIYCTKIVFRGNEVRMEDEDLLETWDYILVVILRIGKSYYVKFLHWHDQTEKLWNKFLI